MISNRRFGPTALTLLALFLDAKGVWDLNHIVAVWLAVIIVSLYLIDLVTGRSVLWIPAVFMGGLITTIMVPPMPNTEVAKHAFVTLRNRDGAVGYLTLYPSAGVPAGLIVYFHNNGPGTAFRFNAGFLGSKTSPMVHMTHTKNPDGSVSGVGGRQNATIGPNTDFSITEQLPRDWVIRSLQPSDQVHEIPAGQYEYCDETGQYWCKNFMLWIQGPPFNRVKEAGTFGRPRIPDTPKTTAVVDPPCEGIGPH